MMDALQTTSRDLDRLEIKLKDLLDRLNVLEEENRSLHARQEALVMERASLVKRNEEARSRVEAMINRLKTMENAG